MLWWHERLFTWTHRKRNRKAAKHEMSTYTVLRAAEADCTAHMWPVGDAFFPFCMVVLTSELEPHTCCLLARWLSPDRVEHLSDTVNFSPVNLWTAVALGFAGLGSAHDVSEQIPEARRAGQGDGQRTMAGRGQYTDTPVICPLMFFLTFPAMTSSAGLCSWTNL